MSRTVPNKTFNIDSAENMLIGFNYTRKGFDTCMRKAMGWEEGSTGAGGWIDNVKLHNAFVFYKLATEVAASRVVPDIAPNEAVRAAQGMFRAGSQSLKYHGSSIQMTVGTGASAQSRLISEDVLKVVQIFNLGTEPLRVAANWYRYFHGPTPSHAVGRLNMGQIGQALFSYQGEREGWDRVFMDDITGRSKSPLYIAEHSFNYWALQQYVQRTPDIDVRATVMPYYSNMLELATKHHSSLCANSAAALASNYGLGQNLVDQAVEVVRQFLPETVDRLQKEQASLWPEDNVRRKDIDGELNLLNRYIPPPPPPPRV
jgi:hypothetical protein